MVKKHPLQNRTNVQIKGGGGQSPFEQSSKKLHFSERRASLIAPNWQADVDLETEPIAGHKLLQWKFLGV